MIKTHGGKSCILRPKKYSLKNNYKGIFCHGPLPFPTRPPLSPQNPLDHVSAFIRPLKIVVWGPRPPRSLYHFFLSVNRSYPGTTSAASQRSYNPLVRLLGSQCKAALTHLYQCQDTMYIKVLDMWLIS